MLALLPTIIRGAILATDFRKTILEKLKKLGRSKYWLSEQLGGSPSRNALYVYLRDDGESDMTGSNIGRILDVLAAEEERQRRS
jgi:hypothetical protein